MIKDIWRALFGREKPHYSDGYRSQKIQIRVSEEEKEIIDKLADLNKMTTANFVRWVILKKYLDDFIKG